MKVSLIIFFLHPGGIVLLSAHVQNTTIVSFFSFYFDRYFNSFLWVILLLRFSINEYLLFLHAYFTHIRMLSGALVII